MKNELMDETGPKIMEKRTNSTLPEDTTPPPSGDPQQRTLTPKKRPRTPDNSPDKGKDAEQSSTEQKYRNRKGEATTDGSAEQHGEEDVDDRLQRLLDAADAKDSATICSILGCKQNLLSHSLNDHLLYTSSQESLFHRKGGPALPQMLLLALLDHIPTAYQIPWIAATRIHISDRTTLASIQQLLRSAVAAWCQYDRKQTASPAANGTRATPNKSPTNKNTKSANTTPRHYILQLVQQTAQTFVRGRLLPEENKSETTLAAELLLSIVSVVRNLAERILLDACMDCIMMQSVATEDIDALDLVSWLQLVSDLRRLLRPKDWKRAHQIAAEHVPNIAPTELAHAAQFIMTLAVHLATNASGQKNQPVQRLVDWQQIWMEIMLAASSDVVTAGAMEQAALQCMSQMTEPDLACYMRSFMALTSDESRGGDDETRWSAIQCNLVLSIARCQRQLGSQLLCRMLAHTQGQSKSNQKQDDIEASCWKYLLSKSLEEDFVGVVVRGRRVGVLTISHVGSVLGGLAYAGNGVFIAADETPNQSLSRAGETIFDSLFLVHKGITDDDRTCAMERARSWMHMAMRIVEEPADKEDMRDWVLCCLTLVTAYCEIPDIRAEIVERMLDNFSRDRFFDRAVSERCCLLCQVISILVKSQPQPESSRLHCPLDKLAAAFDNKLPFAVFADLASSLSSLSSVRCGLLAVAKEHLRVGSSFAWLSEAENGSVRKLCDEAERLQCALFALVTSVATAEWSSVEVEGWCLLSDIIFACKPCLSTSTRSWVIGLLTDRVADAAFGPAAAEHMLSAVLFRLLDFLDTTDDGKEEFSASKVIIPIRHSNSSLALIEDISGLLRLAMSLCHAFVNGKVELETSIEWQHELLGLVAQTATERRRAHPRSPSSESISVLVDNTFIFVVRIMECIAGVSYAAYARHKFSASRSRISAAARQAFSAIDSLPSWLSETRQSPIDCDSWCNVGKEALEADELHVLHGILCGVIPELVLGWRHDSYTVISSYVDGTPDGLKRHLVIELSRLFAMAKHDGPNGKLMPKTNAMSRFETFLSFTRLLVPVFETPLALNDNHAGTKIILDAVIGLCTAVTDCLELHKDVNFPIGSRLLRTAMLLYTSLSSEKAASRLCDMLGVSSDDEIALLIRNFRHKVVALLANCIPFVSQLEPVSASRNRMPSQHADVEGPGPIVQLSEILSWTSRDLVEGMQGTSGMIDYDLFDAFHECIQASVGESLQQLPICNSPRHLHKLASSCILAGKHLERIVCSFALRTSSIFKMTLTFSMYNLPLVARTAIRQLYLLGGPVQFERGCRRQSCSFNVTSLEQCLAIMRKRKINIPWQDAVGSEHMLDYSTDPQPQQDKVVWTSKHLQLISEQHWQWALSLSLECLENLWDESLICLKDGTSYFKSAESAEDYANARRETLARAWNSLTPLLLSESNSSVEAAYLPSRIKLRLIGLLERIVVVQQRSLRSTIHCILKSQDASISRRLDVVEATGCILVWLHTPGSMDIIESASSWYASEQEHKQRTRAALGRIDCVQASLRRLERVIGSTKGQPGELIIELADRLTYRCKGMIQGESDRNGDADATEGRLLQVVQAKREFIERSRQKLSDADRSQLRARVVEITKLARKERNKKAFRSRNKAVDTFYDDDHRQHLDYIKGSGMDDAFDEDGYDLEDFLVDG